MKKYIIIILLIGLILPKPTTAAPDLAAQQQLEKELQAIETQITELEQQLTATKGEKKTLNNKIKQLKNEQAKLRLQIKATGLKINELDKKLSLTAQSISANKIKIARLKTDLAKLIRLFYQKNQELWLLRLFIDGGISRTFIEIENYKKLSAAINALVQESKILQKELAAQQTTYENQQDDARELLNMANVQQGALQGKLGEQTQLLKETQGLETS